MALIKKAAYIAVASAIALLMLLARYLPYSLLLVPCMFHKYTGLYCAGCGGTRALILLTRGDIWGAIRHNALVLLLPAVLYFYIAGFIRTFFKKPLLPLPKNHVAWLWSLLVIVLSFMVLRNLNFFPFTLLKP